MKPESFNAFTDESGGRGLIHPNGENDFSGAESMLRECIAKLSTNNRGSLRQQLNRLIDSIPKGRLGPFSFSGGVTAHIGRASILFLDQKARACYELEDEELLSRLGQTPSTRIQQTRFPWLVFYPPGTQIKNAMRRKHPLLPRSTQWALKNDWAIEFPAGRDSFPELATGKAPRLDSWQAGS